MGNLYIVDKYRDYFNGKKNPDDIAQVYAYEYHKTKNHITFDVDLANELIKASPRSNFKVDKTFLEDVSNKYEYEDVKIKNADVSKDGIVVSLINDEDYKTEYNVLIDGHHRAIKAYREKLDFHVQCLTYQETLMCLISTTDLKLIPLAEHLFGLA